MNPGAQYALIARDSILSAGSIELMVEDPEYAESCPAPILQCLQVKPISANTSGITRWRAVLSDGRYWIQTMLARSAGHLVDDGKLVKGCICRVKGCMPTRVRKTTVLVITSMEVIRSFGILDKIGPPSQLLTTVDPGSQVIEFGATKEYFFSCRRLLSFPLEIFNMIVAHLNQRDKLALSLASRELCALVRPSLYSVVELKSRGSLVHFAKLAAREPGLRNSVRTCILEGDVCCIDVEACNFHIDTITSLPLLRNLAFHPCDEVVSACSLVIMLPRLVSDRTLQSLKSFHIDLDCRYAYDLPNNLQEQMLEAMFSAPVMKHLQISYCHRYHDDFQGRRMREITNLRLNQTQTKYTDLRTLAFQWDGLPLRLLYTILQFPRSLEAFTLRIAGRYNHALSRSPMTIESALSPINTSVRELEVDFVHRVDGNWPEGVGLKFGATGLTLFTRLRHLTISGTFLTEKHGFDGKRPWLPPSLASLCITTSKLCHSEKAELNLDDPPIRRLARRKNFVFFHPTNDYSLEILSGMLETVPSLTQFIIKQDGHGYGMYQRSFVARYPPTLVVKQSLQPLVDRGLRFGLHFAEAPNIWLEVMVAPRL
ncbi:hypothetical protein BJY00DRAFT_179593 [Aspergillus carlsbadensis]|nr:hypothetical protein BJY00DRAFT_179593 [Aspergillus carlsbadensis]